MPASSSITDHQGNKQKRDGTADLLKGFAVLLMIQVHLMEQFASPDTYQSLIGKVSMFLGGPFCAPVFLAVMGYFLAVSSRPLTYFLKRGAILFGGGILLNTARSANLLVHIFRGKYDLDPWFYILGADILTLAGLSLALIGLLRVVFRDKWPFYLITALAVAAVNPLMNQVGLSFPAYAMAFLWGTLEWSYFPLFPWFAYVLAGYAFRLFLTQTKIAGKIDVQSQIIYFIPLFIGVIITIPWASDITYTLEGPNGYYHHGILFFGWVVLFMAAYLVLIKLIEHFYGDKRLFRGIKWVGKRVTSLYVIQWLIIGNIATWLYRTQDLFQFLAWFAAITFATLLIGWIFEKNRKRQTR